MPNNPVQVVLNTRDFIVVPAKHRGGGNKDFFADRDAEFKEHRASLQKKVGAIRSSFQRSGKRSGFVKVTMRKEAWAKSHRPDSALFPETETACVGASNLGELYYMVTDLQLGRIDAEIGRAEDETRWKVNERTQKRKPSPTDRRSEVGAIESIDLPQITEKRKFNAEEAVRWFTDKRTGGLYLIEIFAPDTGLFRTELSYLERAMRSVTTSASGVHLNVELVKLQFRNNDLASAHVFGARLLSQGTSGSVESSPIEHQRFLRFLDGMDEVRRVLLPPVVTSSKSNFQVGAEGTLQFERPELPERVAGRVYPKIAIVDGGLSSFYDPWIVGRHDLLADEHRSVDHGDFIAGLLVCGQAVNGPFICSDSDGCELYDLALLPDERVVEAFEQYYPNNVLDFMQELEAAVEEVKREHGIRVFNMSLNLLDPVGDESYGIVADLLDKIADRHDVVFVLSAGNLETRDHRPIWPADPKAAVRLLAARSAPDTILQPSESARSLTVGALNPPNVKPCVEGAPACYTRRGPGMRVGVKPDLGHFGGAVPTSKQHSGLASIRGDGSIVRDHGTSYAAPIAAKGVSVLESQVVGGLTRESLVALTVHSANLPDVLKHRSLRHIARQFVGFGKPGAALETLITSDYEITLVFTDNLVMNHEMNFAFSWPQCLVNSDGSCRGKAKMSLAYRPILDARFGSEFVRLNIDARLQQEEASGFKGRVPQSSLPDSKDAHIEADLIEHGLKWWPTKVYEASFPEGKGNSSNWRLVLKSLTRAGQGFPRQGVPFTVNLTISDLNNSEPVFRDMRLHLNSQNVKIADIRTGTQLRPTV